MSRLSPALLLRVPIIPQTTNLVEVYNTELVQKDRGEHFVFDPKAGFPMLPPGSEFEGILNKHLGLKSDIVNNTLKILSDIVTKGCGEKVYATGFFVVISNDVGERFLDNIVPKGSSFPWDSDPFHGSLAPH